MEQRLEVFVAGRSAAEAGQLAAELAGSLRMAVPGVQAELRKVSAETMDLGAVVGIIFGSAAATAVGHGVGQWLARRHNAEIAIKNGTGQFVAKGLRSADVVRIAELFSAQATPQPD